MLGGIVIFLIVMVIIAIIVKILKRVAKALHLSLLDKLLGFILGCFQAMIVIFLLSLFIQILPLQEKPRQPLQTHLLWNGAMRKSLEFLKRPSLTPKSVTSPIIRNF